MKNTRNLEQQFYWLATMRNRLTDLRQYLTAAWSEIRKPKETNEDGVA